MVKNAGSKNKRGRLMKNMKSPNSGLIVICCCITGSRLTVVSREAKKKQHACASSGPRDHYSELFTRMAALKF